MKRILLLTITLMSLLSTSASDDYRYRSITMNDGLLANAVRNIVQDPHGFIWLGTDNGLCRYDGTQVLPYRLPQLGINQYISSLLAHEGALYIGTEKGVYCLAQETQQISRLPMDISSVVTSLQTDREGNLWATTLRDGVWRYSIKTGQTRQYKMDGDFNGAADVLIDHDNQIWTVTNWGGPYIQRLNRLHDRFEPVNIHYDRQYGGLRLLQTRDGRIWIGTWDEGLLLMHSDGRLEQVLAPALTGVGSHIYTLAERDRNDGQAGGGSDICIGCDDGVICLNPDTRQWKRLFEASQGIRDRFVYAITSDTEGGLWVGTFYGGVHYLSPVGKRFEVLSMENGLRGNVVSSICEDRQGRIWIASDDGGVMCYAPQEQRFADIPHQSTLAHQNAHALCFVGPELWIGTYTSGVMVLDTESGRLRQYTQNQDPHSLDNSSCYALYTDSSGQLWVGTMEGLNRYNRAEDHFDRIGSTGATIIDIDEDRQGRLWLSAQGTGLWRYDTATQQLRQYLHDEGHDHSLPNNQVNCTMVDQEGRLWIGTLGGLCRYDATGDRFEHIRLDVPSQNIMGIIEDNGALWLSTERGIVKYEPKQAATTADKGTSRPTQGEDVLRLTRFDGLASEQFQPNAGLKASDGRIYLGSTSGLCSFFPYRIKANSVMPPVYITTMSLLNHEAHTPEGLPRDLSLTTELALEYSDARMLTLSFAALSYCSPEKNQYAYRLEGFDRNWNYVGNQNRATYTNLSAGTYEFRVKATNNDGVWSASEARLRIVVHPPFWWSWYAKTLYLTLIGAAIWYYVRVRLRQAERQHQQEIERLSATKEQEAREARLNFFTMIAHEIRTPVSLIIGPLEKLMKQGAPSDDLRIIDRNAHRLLELVNQLLDFRKVEQQSLTVRFAPQNIYELMRSVSERFAPTFEQGGRQLDIDYPDERFTAMIDSEAITKVISNLLTNANKYTRDWVRLSCTVDPDDRHFRIEVADNGAGISEADRSHIFEPFFQAQNNKPGTGIGLNIVKNIVDQHHGAISVASEVGRGSVFTVVLPIRQEVIGEAETAAKTAEARPQGPETAAAGLPATAGQPAPPSAAAPRPLMLIVDDSDDMVGFLSANFSEKYDVATAADGIEALDTLARRQVSIIISDWMMPRMDGAELCRRVRRNPQTSHIPFVMLTAKTDDDSKVAGMDVGADIYIEKPFSISYLEACIRNTLDMRQRLMRKFSTQPLEPVTEIASNQTDNEFLQKMNQLIEDNFSNSDLNVSFLAEKLNISRSGLFAKIKALADVTPNEMIQIVRLKKAARLLKEGSYQINEVCYMVGFSNPSYFSKCFQKQFGITPGAFCNSDDGGAA